MSHANSNEVIHPAIAAVAAAALGRVDPAGSRGPVSRGDQARLLAEIAATQGPAGLLLAGGHLDTVRGDPIVLALTNSNRPDVLLDKIDRLNRFLHSSHRHRVVASTDHSVELEHRSTSAVPPSPFESLFVCGLYLAMLTRIGCRDVTCAFPLASSGDRVVYRAGSIDGTVAIEQTGRWTIGWSGIDPVRALPGLDEVVLRDLPPDLTVWSVADRVAAVVRSDPSRRWRVADVATELAMSPRTLQRRLAGEASTFSGIVAATRIDVASTLLADPDRSITEVGYLTGFADTAHFSRAFRQATGRSPSGWRHDRA